jgi:UDP-glucuronate decarboxylase
MKNVLDLAVKTGAKVFQSSTSEVYGNPEVHPQPETYHGNVNPYGPRACYDEGKRAAETLCYDYKALHGVDVRLARIFNTYGPRMDENDGRVVSNFILKALNNQPLETYGDGSQTRSFCYVDDLLDGFEALMGLETPPEHPVNLGNPHEFTVRELALIVIHMTNSNSKIINKPLPKDDPLLRRPDIALAKKLFGFTPKIDLTEGLSKTIAYFSSRQQQSA